LEYTVKNVVPASVPIPGGKVKALSQGKGKDPVIIIDFIRQVNWSLSLDDNLLLVDLVSKQKEWSRIDRKTVRHIVNLGYRNMDPTTSALKRVVDASRQVVKV